MLTLTENASTLIKNLDLTLGDGSVVDRLDTALLELLQVIPHSLEHLGGVFFPVHDLADDARWLLRAVGPRRIGAFGESLERTSGLSFST